MGERIDKMKSTARKKGALALVAGIGTGVLYWKTGWPLGVAGTIGTLILTSQWFIYRAKNGMRF